VNGRYKAAHAPRSILPRLNPRPLFPHVFVFSSLLGPQTTANSNHSRTSAAFARKSNHSRTYAKTGGRGCLLQYAHFDNLLVILPIIYLQLKCKMSARRHFWSAAARRRFWGSDKIAPFQLFARSGGHRKSRSKLPHSEGSFRPHCGNAKSRSLALLGMTNHVPQVAGHESRLPPAARRRTGPTTRKRNPRASQGAAGTMYRAPTRDAGRRVWGGGQIFAGSEPGNARPCLRGRLGF
jgi:hypothetical protein